MAASRPPPLNNEPAQCPPTTELAFRMGFVDAAKKALNTALVEFKYANGSRYTFRPGEEEAYQAGKIPKGAPQNVIWPVVVFFALHHSLAAYGLAMLGEVHPYTIVFSVLFYVGCMVGIFVGFHRLWAHQAFKAHVALEALLVFLSSAAFSMSALFWCRDHRLHHKFSDTDLDPHNAQRGFWYSHMFWLMLEPRAEVKAEAKKIHMADLEANWILQFQDRNYIGVTVLSCIVFPTVTCGYLWGDYRGGFFVAAMLRHACVLHGHWTTASFAHLVGERKYNKDLFPGDSAVVSAISGGEGWHNYHHCYPWDYAASEEVILPLNYSTKFIRAARALGLATDLRSANLAGRADRERKMTMAEVRRAAEDGARLVVIRGKVYDMTGFDDIHPGGQGVIVKRFGQDATAVFEKSHVPTMVKAAMETFQAGVIVG